MSGSKPFTHLLQDFLSVIIKHETTPSLAAATHAARTCAA